jgi:hypothetical protein
MPLTVIDDLVLLLDPVRQIFQGVDELLLLTAQEKERLLRLGSVAFYGLLPRATASLKSGRRGSIVATKV